MASLSEPPGVSDASRESYSDALLSTEETIEEYAPAAQQPRQPQQPHFLDTEQLCQTVRPTDAQMALCCLYANRWHTMKRLQRVSQRLGMRPELVVWDQFEDRRTGLRMVTFCSEVQALDGGGQVAAAVFAFRGTRLNKGGNLRADLQLLRNLDAELFLTQRATRKVGKHMRRLQEQHPGVQWAFFTTGHSLGGFTAAASMILEPRLLQAVTFESPGLTTFYHNLAAQAGNEHDWQQRIVNYLAIPNPINMCQRHLGRMVRVYTRIEAKTDAFHICKCLFGTSIRVLNWFLAANLLWCALRILSGGVTSLWACLGLITAERSWRTLKVFVANECGLELAVAPGALATSAFWTLRGASAYVAGRLGTTLTHIWQQHSMLNMLKAFDGDTGLPRRCVEMASWPRMDRLGGSFRLHLQRALVESFFPTHTTEGVSVLFDRNRMIEARIRILPDYVELRPTIIDPEADPMLEFLEHNLFWQEDLDVEDHGQPDAVPTDDQLDSMAEDEEVLKTHSTKSLLIP